MAKLFTLTITATFAACLAAATCTYAQQPAAGPVDPNTPSAPSDQRHQIELPAPPDIKIDPNALIDPCDVIDPCDFRQLTDPNTDPNGVTFDRVLQSEPNRLASGAQPARYWLRRYHPQVTERIFAVLRYPYYPGGTDYDRATLPTAALATPHSQAPPPNLPAIHRMVQQCSDIIHRWRDLNESPATVLEILRTVELTKTSTNIYNIDAELAIDAKRTVGQIGRVNHRLDLTSRIIIHNAIAGQPDKALFAHLEKQLNDLESLLERLAHQNDRISVALGVGKIDRRLPPNFFEPIDYSSSTLPTPTTD